MHNKHTKRCSASAGIIEVQIRVPVRQHFTPFRMAVMGGKNKKQQNRVCSELENFLLHWPANRGDCGWIDTMTFGWQTGKDKRLETLYALSGTIKQCLRCGKHKLPHNPNTPLLGTHPQQLGATWIYWHSVAESQTKGAKSPAVVSGGTDQQWRYIRTTGYDSALKKSKIVIHTAT